MKFCVRCQKDRPLIDWGKDAYWCKPCHREYDNDRYKNSPERRLRVRQSAAQTAKIVSERVWAYLLAHPCVDCEEDDPIVLQFDHVRGKKKESVSILAASHSWKMVAAEIEKCEIRCANCHLRRHARQYKWYNRIGINLELIYSAEDVSGENEPVQF